MKDIVKVRPLRPYEKVKLRHLKGQRRDARRSQTDRAAASHACRRGDSRWLFLRAAACSMSTVRRQLDMNLGKPLLTERHQMQIVNELPMTGGVAGQDPGGHRQIGKAPESSRRAGRARRRRALRIADYYYDIGLPHRRASLVTSMGPASDARWAVRCRSTARARLDTL
jgi:hypothetical protein